MITASMNLRGRRALVVGGAATAAEAVRLLLSVGAEVSVLAPALGDDLSALVGTGRVRHLPRGFQPEALNGCHLVVAADGDSVNRKVAEEADRQGRAVAVPGHPEWSSVQLPLPAARRRSGGEVYLV